MDPIISAQATALLWGAVFFIAALGYWCERKTVWGRKFSGVMVALTGAIILSNLRVIPTEADVYNTIFDQLLPVAIPLLLLRTNLRFVIQEAGPTIIAFFIATLGVIAGTFMGVLLTPLSGIEAQMAGMFSATYIGGSVNFFAVAEAAGITRDDTLIAAIAADNMATNVYLVILISIPGITFFKTRFKNVHDEAVPLDSELLDSSLHKVKELDIIGLLFALGVAFSIAYAGEILALFIGLPDLAIIFVTALTLLIAMLMPGQVQRLSGDREAGNVMILLFLTAVGASADLWKMIEFGPILFVFAMIIILVHMLVLFVMGYFLRIDLAELIVASSACVGGASSAGAIASAKGWSSLVTPGILLGSIGNGVGTFIGISLYGLLL